MIISMRNCYIQLLNEDNQTNQIYCNQFTKSIKISKVVLNDLKSRFASFVHLGIKLPTGRLIKSYFN